MILMSVLSVGCNPKLYQDVTIVYTYDDNFVSYGYTIVEFPDGTRYRRNYIYGEKGDTFKAYRKGRNWR